MNDCRRDACRIGENTMMQNFDNMMPAMGWTMGLIWLLIVLVLVLGVAALIKYLFGSK